MKSEEFATALVVRRMLLVCCLLWSAAANSSLFILHSSFFTLHSSFFTLHSSLIKAQTTITLTGDILLDRGVRRYIMQKGIDSLFTPQIDSIFAHSDIVVGNLECPATNIHTPAVKQYVFRGNPEWLHDLRRHGITHLNLANNHSVDQRRGGLRDTYKNCLGAHIVPVGAGTNMDEASEAILIAAHKFSEVRGTRYEVREMQVNTRNIHQHGEIEVFSHLAPRTSHLVPSTSHLVPRNIYLLASQRLKLENFTYLPDSFSVSQEPLDTLCRRIERLRAKDSTAYIIVCLHWGAEHQLKPMALQRQEAHRIIDAGADIIVGHHTHTLQTIEEYKGKPIYYSIGNFIFDQEKPLNTRACMVQIKIAPDAVAVETIPIDIRHCVPHIATTY